MGGTGVTAGTGGGGFFFFKNEGSEPSPGTVHLTLPQKESWVDPVELDGVSGILPLTWSCATPNTLDHL